LEVDDRVRAGVDALHPAIKAEAMVIVKTAGRVLLFMTLGRSAGRPGCG
jgi:hypothetical protein